jgi:hypothetical protein
MIIFTLRVKPESKSNPFLPKYEGVKMSLVQHLSHSFEEENYKYDWKQGTLESEEKMKIKEAEIFQ